MSFCGTAARSRAWSRSSSRILHLALFADAIVGLVRLEVLRDLGSLTVTCDRNLSAVSATTSSLTFSLRRRYSLSTSASETAIQPVIADRSLSRIRLRLSHLRTATSSPADSATATAARSAVRQ
jgi:hypothetical protein